MYKGRCIRCNRRLREDGTCQNEKCVLYRPKTEPKVKGKKAETMEDK